MSDEAGPAPTPPIREHRSEGAVCLELGPTGITRTHAVFALQLAFLGTFGLALGGTGLTLALTARDFGVPLRLALGLVSSVGVVAGLLPALVVLADGLLRRERVVVGRDGLRVLEGTPIRSRRHRLDRSASRSLGLRPIPGLRRLWLSAAPADRQAALWLEGSDHGATVPLGIGHGPALRQALAGRLEAALAATTDAPPVDLDPLAARFDWPLGDAARRLRALALDPLRARRGYVVLDLLVLGGAIAVAELYVLELPLARLYPAELAAYAVALALRAGDGRYLAGLRAQCAAWFSYPVFFVLAGVLMGLAAGFGLVMAGVPPLLGLPLGFGPILGLHLVLLRRRGTASPPEAGPGRRRLQTALLVPLAVHHEHLAFLFFEDSARRFFVLAVVMVPPVIGLLYLPVRMHAFIETPGDPGNRAWLALTIALVTVQAVLGVAPL